MLYVEADNSAAVKTYERLGFTVFSVDAAYANGEGGTPDSTVTTGICF